MSAHIEINGSATRLNIQLRNMLNALQNVQEDSAQLKAIFDQIALGDDFISLGAALSITPENATTVYNLLGGANTELHATGIVQMLSRLG